MRERHQEIHGMTHNGEWILLGRIRISDESSRKFLGKISSLIGKENGYFNINCAVFSSDGFIGIKMTPGIELEDL